MRTLQEFFTYELEDIYSAADFLQGILKDLSCKATHPLVVECAETYYNQSCYQFEMLDEWFDGKKGHTCFAMRKLTDAVRASFSYQGSSTIRDVVLLLMLQLIKHYEIASIGTALAHAYKLEEDEPIDLLHALKKKIAEDEDELVQNAQYLIDYHFSDLLLEELKSLLSVMVTTHLKDLPPVEVFTENELMESINWFSEIQAVLQGEKGNLPNSQPITEWKVMDGFMEELHAIPTENQDLKMIGSIAMMQRIQHHHIALLEFESLISRYIGNEYSLFETLVKKGIKHDRRLTAIEAGTFFHEGLDAKLKKGSV